MNKAKETKSRRAAALSILGAGWTAKAGDKARDMFTARNGNRTACIQPERTIDGNFYVGRSVVKGMGGGFCYTQTIEQAAEIANAWLN
jgi:hypothetical protein